MWCLEGEEEEVEVCKLIMKNTTTKEVNILELIAVDG